MNAESIRVESDEYGFELHIDTTDDGTLIFNVHGCAEELYDTVKRNIGPWLQERDAVKADFDRTTGRDDPYASDDDGPWPGESVQAFYERTGQDGPLREVADAMNKARKEQR
jgi:hypothetical protein